MKIFKDNSESCNESINFVDDNNVFVGYDYSQCCCEQFGYELNPELENYDGYNFDTSYCESVDYNNEEDTAAIQFKLVKDNKSIFLTLYNCHNGYYAHGFEMKKEGKTLHAGSL